MIEIALRTNDDPAGRYLLLTNARDLAIASGDTIWCVRAIHYLWEDYDIDPWAEKSTALKQIPLGTLNRKEKSEFVNLLMDQAGEAVLNDRFDVGMELGKTALVVAQKLRDAQVVKKVASRLQQFEAATTEFRAAQLTLSKLEKEPNNPDANLAYGRYLCLFQGDWRRGLILLARGSDPEAARLAQRDLQWPRELGDVVSLGDAWVDLANKDRRYQGFQIQAFVHYHRARNLPSGGVLSERAERKAKELAALAGSVPRLAWERWRDPPTDVSASPPTSELIKITPLADSKWVEIPANAPRGYVIGPVRRGDTVRLQYAGGTWTFWDAPAVVNPDHSYGRGNNRSLLTIVALGERSSADRVVSVVAEGTRYYPYEYRADSDCRLALRINDTGGRWDDNRGRVYYRVAIDRP